MMRLLIRNTYARRKDMILTFAVLLFIVLLIRTIISGLSIETEWFRYVAQAPSIADVIAVIGIIGSYVWKRGVDVRNGKVGNDSDKD